VQGEINGGLRPQEVKNTAGLYDCFVGEGIFPGGFLFYRLIPEGMSLGCVLVCFMYSLT
jgi:hypothetical protein